MVTSNILEKPVGLLFDSVSDNTGDIAIGIALEEHLNKKKIGYEVVNPFNYNTGNYSFLIVGGGQIIRPVSDPFYDSFRVPGKHILNGVGVDNFESLEYLEDYSAVSVRSKSVAEKINKIYPNIKPLVVPCVTVLLDSAKEESIPQEANTIGLHLVSDTFIKCPGIIEVLSNISKPKITFSFTTYNYDSQLMSVTSIWGIKKHYNNMRPMEIHSLIGSMGGVIVSSLHATIFAHSQNIPFLTFFQPKTYEYLKDRGLEQLVFRNTEELVEKLPFLDKDWNFTDDVNIEKKKISEFLDTAIEKAILANSNESNIQNIKVSNPKGKSELLLFQHFHVLSQRDQLIAKILEDSNNLSQSIEKSNNRIESQTIYLLKLEGEIVSKDQEINNLKNELFAVRNTIGYKILLRINAIKQRLLKILKIR